MIAMAEDNTGKPALDDLIPLREAAALLPSRSRGKKTHVATLFRWTTTGCRGIKLRFLSIGATRCTTKAWLDEFFEALTAASSPLGGEEGHQRPASKPVATSGARTAAQRARDHARAERELEAAGI